MLEKGVQSNEVNAAMIMSINPKTIDASSLAVGALDLMRKNNITQLLVHHNGKYAGVIHLHDLIKEGLI
jgi:arabinose-5-phosphate isomerase